MPEPGDSGEFSFQQKQGFAVSVWSIAVRLLPERSGCSIVSMLSKVDRYIDVFCPG
jgi:hypothetical protein